MERSKLLKLGLYMRNMCKSGIKHVLILDEKVVLYVKRENLRTVMRFLKKNGLVKMDTLMDVWGVDFLGRAERFEVNYLLTSVRYNYRMVVKVGVDSKLSTLPSISDTYGSANWLEREVWDMYGVFFEGHEDLRRILSDYGFKGHPLRKDYPLSGYSEVRYDEGQKRVVEEPIELGQEYRVFNFESPWEKKNNKRK